MMMTPPGKPARQESELSLVRYTWVKLTMTPPHITLKQKLEMVYSFTFYAALYITVTLCVVSFGVEQVDRSVMHSFL